MSRFSEKGYVVKENAPIYLTLDMDKTAKWFEDVLGWYSNIVERDSSGKGCYGVVFDMVPEVELVHLAPFTGFQMFCGIQYSLRIHTWRIYQASPSIFSRRRACKR